MEEKVEQKKFSYEELEGICNQLSEQNRQLYTRLQEIDLVNLFKRLDYLFKVVENNSVFDKEFVKSCIKEIQEGLTIQEEVTDTQKDKEK